MDVWMSEWSCQGPIANISQIVIMCWWGRDNKEEIFVLNKNDLLERLENIFVQKFYLQEASVLGPLTRWGEV